MKAKKYKLPWPPSMNTCWRSICIKGQPRVIMSKKGREYRAAVIDSVQDETRPLESRLAVTIKVFPPDKRKRDLDNLPKAILDGLMHGGVFVDDSQIDRLEIIRCEKVKGGRVEVTLKELKQ